MKQITFRRPDPPDGGVIQTAGTGPAIIKGEREHAVSLSQVVGWATRWMGWVREVTSTIISFAMVW